MGAFLIPGCLIIAIGSFRVIAEQYDQNFLGWSEAQNLFGQRIGKDLLFSFLGLIGGIILALKPKSAEFAGM